MSSVFVTGAGGFMGRRLTAELVRRGHRVTGLVRPGSESRAAAGCEVVAGDALDPATYRDRVSGCDTFVHLVGVAHPSPAKAAQFRTIDLASTKSALSAAVAAAVTHFVYVSVAQPAPVMRAYIAARQEGEAAIRAAGLAATIVRPWYVLGPGRRWPLLLSPVFRLLPPRLGLVTVEQMVATFAASIENPPHGIRIVEVPEIRASLPS